MTSAAVLPRRFDPVRWWRTFGRAPRIVGLDIARALAILGMVGAHVGETTDISLVDPVSWLGGAVHGHPSLLFAMLAGVSICLLTHRIHTADAAGVIATRMTMVGRGATIFIIGVALEAMNSPIAVILSLYGVLYIAVIPFLAWRTSRLVIASITLAVVGPVLMTVLSFMGVAEGAGVRLVISGTYPLTVWMSLMFAGMAIGRVGPGSVRIAWRLVVGGVVLCAAGFALSDVLIPLIPSGNGAESNLFVGIAGALASSSPHSGSTLEVIASGGLAMAVIGTCVLLSRPLRWLLLPLAALGSMPLTAYSAHVISVAILLHTGHEVAGNNIWAWTAIGMLVGATLWAMAFGRGPLERLVARVARAAASAPVTPASAAPALAAPARTR